MNLLFDKNDTGTDEVAKYAGWTSSHNYLQIKEDLLLAQKWISKIIDKTTYQTALNHYLSADYDNPTTEDHTRLNKLVEYIQRPMVRYAYSQNIVESTIIQDNSGIKVTWSEKFRPAQQQTLDNLQSSHEQKAYDFLDILIEFLNENNQIFTDFHNSIENLNIKTLFINDFKDFCKYVNIRTTAYFYEIIDIINRVQNQEIKAALGPWYTKTQNYQQKRLKLEAVTQSVTDITDLDNLTPAENDIVLVNSVGIYYIYITEWTEYATDCREILKLIKPTLVDLTMHYRLLSNLTNYSVHEPRIKVIRASAALFYDHGTTGLSKIQDYISSLAILEEPEPQTETTTGDLSFTSNSLML